MQHCSMKSLFVLAMVLAIGQALRVPEWANSLVTRFDKTIGSTSFEIVARAPKGGKGGGGGDSGSGSSSGGSGSGSGSGSSSGSGSCGTDYSTRTSCLSSEKICGNACIPSSATCCTLSSSLYSYYCSSSERCITSSYSSSLYKCCPSTSSTCTSTSLSANYATSGTFRYGKKACASAATRMWEGTLSMAMICTIFTGGYVFARR